MPEGNALRGVRSVWVGVALALVFTFVAAITDGIIKYCASHFEAPQLFVFSGVLICLFCVTGSRWTGERLDWRTAHPIAMGLRSVCACVAVVGYYYAFKHLDFAEVFLFIGLAPLLSGVAAKPVLGEQVAGRSWLALGVAGVGVGLLFPGATDGKLIGYVCASVGVLTGTLSIVLSRYISQREHRPMLLIFYPNVVISGAMLALLPFVYVPMAWIDVFWITAYSLFMFLSRWLIVEAVKLVPAHFLTVMVNTQFIWMVMIGALIFSEWPSEQVFAGALLLIAASVWVVREQLVHAGAHGRPPSDQSAGSNP